MLDARISTMRLYQVSAIVSFICDGYLENPATRHAYANSVPIRIRHLGLSNHGNLVDRQMNAFLPIKYDAFILK